MAEGARLESELTLICYAGSNPALSARLFCRARWGTSGALYLQSATAGSKAYAEASICKACPP